MPPESLIDETLSHFPDMDHGGNVVIERLQKGGSDRKYYRIKFTDAHSLILVKYGSLRDENHQFCVIAEYLDLLGVRVPKIYHHDESEGLIWMEDLGERDLWSFRRESPRLKMELYRATLDQIAILHNRTSPVPDVQPLRLQAEFNAELYRWEQRYFFENCLQRYFGINPAVVEKRANIEVLGSIADRLASLPRTLVHRDFQSQNVIIYNGHPCLIDFQGLRPGLPHYDVASLVYDPYVLMENGQRELLIDHYLIRQTHSAHSTPEAFREIFDLCAVQRLMQALGAYGYLGLVRERAVFLGYIPTAVSSLRLVLNRLPQLAELSGMIEELC
jgi:aminoglycoside/choline kinase family phosphotransferase